MVPFSFKSELSYSRVMKIQLFGLNLQLLEPAVDFLEVEIKRALISPAPLFQKYRTTLGWAFRTSRKSASFRNWRACQSQELTRLRTEICGARLSAYRLPQVYASRKRVAI
jgi:hypothetical protein